MAEAEEREAGEAARELILRRERALIATLRGVAGHAIPDRRTLARFRRLVLDHYRCCGRDLAWRHDFDPYRILVSEVMLQQTQVSRVATRYASFVDRFPGFDALAAAPLADVLDEWQGMGYNRRALLLKRLAEEVVSRHGGELPPDLAAIDALPGVGHATAAAVMATSFGVAVPYVETNIRAVMLHFFFADETGVPDRDVLPLVDATLDRRDPRHWYYALMDYGAWLKKRETNPSRRSRHHARQAPFVGSMREVRGRVLRALVSPGVATVPEIAALTGVPEPRVTEALDAFEREGLATVEKGLWRVRE